MIGFWIARFRGPIQLTKWHLCETEIEERRYTRCGRVMVEREGTVLAPIQAPPTYDSTCQKCRPEPATPGDEPLR